jgi:hypothetical protein
MEGLYIQALVPITDKNVKAGTTYKNLRGGFAYTVPGLVKIKGQYIGKGAASEDVDAVTEVQGTYIDASGAVQTTASTDYKLKTGETWLREPVKGAAATTKDGNSDCTLEAEVDVLAVEGLFAGVGFQYNIVKDGDDKKADTTGLKDPMDILNAEINGKQKMKIAAAASYQVMPELKVNASGAFFTYYKAGDVKIDPRFQAGVGVDYDLGDGLAANADFRYLSPIKVDGKKTEKTDKIAFSVGVKKSVSSNGSIGVAFQGITNSGSLAGVKGVPDVDKTTKIPEYKNFVWAIPVMIEVAF